MFRSWQLLTALCVGAITACTLAAGTTGHTTDLKGDAVDPFASAAPVRVFLFVRTDCPVTNRYAPELQRISKEFSAKKVQFWLVYPDATEPVSGIESEIQQYGLPGIPVRDPEHLLVKRAHADTAPEAAVFDAAGNLRYHGRIDDRYVDIGKARPQAEVHDLENAIEAVLAGKRIANPVTRAIGCSLADVE